MDEGYQTSQMRCPGESGGAEVTGKGPVVGDGRVPQLVGGGHLGHDPRGMNASYDSHPYLHHFKHTRKKSSEGCIHPVHFVKDT